jgi:hypothetical protein
MVGDLRQDLLDLVGVLVKSSPPQQPGDLVSTDCVTLLLHAIEPPFDSDVQVKRLTCGLPDHVRGLPPSA